MIYYCLIYLAIAIEGLKNFGRYPVLPIPGTYSTDGQLCCHTVNDTGPRLTVSSIGSPHLVVTHKNKSKPKHTKKQKTENNKSKRANPGLHGVFIWFTYCENKPVGKNCSIK